MTQEEKFTKLDELFAEKCDLSGRLINIENTISEIIKTFSAVEASLWSEKVREDYYDTLEEK